MHCFVSSQYLVICFLLRIKDNEIHNVQYHPMLCISYRKYYCRYIEPFLSVFFDIAIFYSMAELIDYHLAVIFDQAWIHIGFHHFTEIGQIFHNRYIFNKEKTFQVARLHLGRMGLGNILSE